MVRPHQTVLCSDQLQRLSTFSSRLISGSNTSRTSQLPELPWSSWPPEVPASPISGRCSIRSHVQFETPSPEPSREWPRSTRACRPAQPAPPFSRVRYHFACGLRGRSAEAFGGQMLSSVSRAPALIAASGRAWYDGQLEVGFSPMRRTRSRKRGSWRMAANAGSMARYGSHTERWAHDLSRAANALSRSPIAT